MTNTYPENADPETKLLEEVRCLRCVNERILRVMDEGLFVDYQMEKFGKFIPTKISDEEILNKVVSYLEKDMQEISKGFHLHDGQDSERYEHVRVCNNIKNFIESLRDGTSWRPS
jgi:hypothetical protein